MGVAELFDEIGKYWDISKLQSLFSDETVNTI